MANSCAGRTMNFKAFAATSSGVGNYGFSFSKFENSIWAEFYATWLSDFRAAVTLF